MLESIKMMPITINAIKVSEKTKNLTGASTIEELNSVSSGLFKGLNEDQLWNTIIDIYNNKLKASDVEIIQAFSKEEKRQHAINALTLQLELTQEMPRVVGGNVESPIINTIGMFLGNRVNVSNQTSLKYSWETISLEMLKNLGFTKGSDFGKAMLKLGIFTYLNKVHSFNPELRDEKYVISAPKRSGTGGNILLKGDKLIFNTIKLVSLKCADEKQYESLFAQYQAAEIKNTEEFKHTSIIDVVENSIPAETRHKKTGRFNPEFEAWLHEYLNIEQGVQVEVAA